MDLGLPVPDFSTLSCRRQSLDITDDIQLSDGPITLIVDSTALQVHRVLSQIFPLFKVQ